MKYYIYGEGTFRVGDLSVMMYTPRRRVGSSLLYISVGYYMEKLGGGQIACKIAYVLN